MPFATFLLSMVQPLVGRVLVALGMSVVTFTGMAALMGGVTDYVVSTYGGLPGDLLSLASLAGIGEGLSIVFGAVSTRVLIWQATRATRMLMNNPA